MATSTNSQLIISEDGKFASVERYSEKKPARIPSELFDVSRAVNKIENVHALRAMFAIAQIVQNQQDQLITELRVPIDVMFEYIGTKKSNRDYELLKSALDLIIDNPLKLVQRKKNGSKVYSGMSWIINYRFATDEKSVRITVNPMAAPYLLQLVQYVSVQPEQYLCLTTAVQTWLYAFLKDKQRLGSFRIKIADLKAMLNMEEHATYQDPSTGNNRFLERVLGIRISADAKEENSRAKKEKRMPIFIPWDYVTRGGKPTGTMYALNANTDLKVAVRAIKQGRSYEEVEFDFRIAAMTAKPKKPSTDSSEGASEMVADSASVWVVLTKDQLLNLLLEYNVSLSELLQIEELRLRQDKNGIIRQYQEVEILARYNRKKEETK